MAARTQTATEPCPCEGFTPDPEAAQYADPEAAVVEELCICGDVEDEHDPIEGCTVGWPE